MRLRAGRSFWKVLIVNAVLMAAIIASCVGLIRARFDRLYDQELTDHLLGRAMALEVAVCDRFDPAHADALAAQARQLGALERGIVRVTFVLEDGRVVGDSHADPARMESHADRPEIVRALADGVGKSTRWSHTVAGELKYVAVRVGPADHPAGVVRVAMPVKSIGDRAAPTRRLALAVGVVSVAAATLVAATFALLWSRRLSQIRAIVTNLSRGDVSDRVDVSGDDEVAALGRALNEMRERLSGNVATIDRQRRTLDALLAQLGEGVVVSDGAGRIVMINEEARRMLRIAPTTMIPSPAGMAVEQCVPQHRLQSMLLHEAPLPVDGPGAAAPAKGESPADQALLDRAQTTLTVRSAKGSMSVLARAFDIRLPAPTDGAIDGSPRAGRALILTDITELTRMMQVKADLAANASHELRTPVSAMRAALDTFQAIDAAHDPASAAHLIDILNRQSLRMEAMIDDLLDLSRLESGVRPFAVANVSVRELVEELRTMFADRIAQRRLRWSVDVVGAARFPARLELLRMILRNLVDNAIRFNREGGEVRLTIDAGVAETEITVADTGCGIPAEEQTRVFERFYQVDRARSGADRGTGLGLSIVRHAASAMRAGVSIDSKLNEGTRVTVRIPKDQGGEPSAEDGAA